MHIVNAYQAPLIDDKQRSKAKRKEQRTRLGCRLLSAAVAILLIAVVVYVVVKVTYVEYLPPDPTLNWPVNGTSQNLDLEAYVKSDLKHPDIVQRNTINYFKWDVKEQGIEISYPKGTFGSNAAGGYGGLHFSLLPPKIYPTKQSCLSYEVKFPSGFDWVTGGKLPGMWIGAYGALGGNENTVSGSSVRIMWRSEGFAEAYMYVPSNSGISDLPGFVASEDKGLSVWRGTPFKFVSGTYNKLKLFIKLNSFTNSNANPDGWLHLTINGQYRSFENIIWTNNDNHNCSGILFQSFFGGSDSSWASRFDQSLVIRNVVAGNSLTACN